MKPRAAPPPWWLGPALVAAVVAAIGACAFALARPARAQMPMLCGDRADLVAQLAAQFGEARRATGVAAGALVELFVSPAGSWTILRSFPNGRACAVGNGDDWQEEPPPVPGKDA